MVASFSALRIVVVALLAAILVSLVVIRLSAGASPTESIPPVAYERHFPGASAHLRHAYRAQLDQGLTANAEARSRQQG
jgi:hypothetical protein